MKQGILLDSFTDAKILVSGQPVLPTEPGSARVERCILRTKPPRRAAGCSAAATELGGTEVPWDWGHEVADNDLNACGSSLFLLGTIRTRRQCEAMVTFTHQVFGHFGNHTSSLQVG